MIRIFVYLVGFGISVIGGVVMLASLNMMTPERGWTGYFVHIRTRIEFYLLPIGLLLMLGSLYFPYREE
ncbi:hypothetical protein [Parageobacillus thermoglucosidasius]|uniref:Uncharacterized protein n=3 Tax=Anoxybacillaceae TaxID=3120669 RepID=A0AAN1D6D8_PARTM|nr:hypothetical protein [Parageobacillus thermoglucosidasius]KYD15489.1 hypothetical protein B4168_2949 [Anoxybacillus flavithermus]REK57816.1 MAG: hypothetical protein C6P36_07045 [Geobacillus sp.]AEH48933.1 hypothetical protein Geoth_3058 [Parageobacillus thermoglucosidasius C56-YS93]ALF09826.1 hypothetical protein AOT13_07340 [Parageobacillus thermoglucosidasius]ANZ29907.1 hypothetical protein BCV53_07345 [Parageobacillus thermoglucosidasius]